MKDKLRQVRDLLNEILSETRETYDVGFYVPHTSEDPYVMVLLGMFTGPQDVEVLAHLRFDEDTERWNYFEGDPR